MITLALSKGRIFDDTLPLLRAAGIEVTEDPERSRKLILATTRPDVRVVLVRASDVPTYVRRGGADIGVAGPTQGAPDMPRRAMQDGTEGVVRAQALIRDGVVKEVTILTGPRVFHAAVRNAMLQYKCTSESGDVLATQEFAFKLE